jgi:hypothetical protein
MRQRAFESMKKLLIQHLHTKKSKLHKDFFVPYAFQRLPQHAGAFMDMLLAVDVNVMPLAYRIQEWCEMMTYLCQSSFKYPWETYLQPVQAKFAEILQFILDHHDKETKFTSERLKKLFAAILAVLNKGHKDNPEYVAKNLDFSALLAQLEAVCKLANAPSLNESVKAISNAHSKLLAWNGSKRKANDTPKPSKKAKQAMTSVQVAE